MSHRDLERRVAALMDDEADEPDVSLGATYWTWNEARGGK